MEFKVLGAMEVSDGGRVLDVGPRMPRIILATLILAANRVVSVDRLVDQLWADVPPATALTALQGYVSILRRALEPNRGPRSAPEVLVTRAPGYVLQIPPEAVDAARFEVLAARGRALLDAGRPGPAREALQSALALWRGEPYADLAYESFVQVEATRLNELRAHASDALAEAHLLARDDTAAADELRRLVALDPLRERRWELLALALYRGGRQAEALRALAAARETLGEQLGLEPGPALRRLEHDILVQSPELDWQQPVERPLDDGRVVSIDGVGARQTPTHRPLVGRAPELEDLQSALDAACDRQGGVALVTGEAGIGKTRLVEELGDQALARGVLVAWGRCDESEMAAAYWPWIQIIRTLVEEGAPEAVRNALRGRATDIAQIVPDVKEVAGAEMEPLVLLEPEAARARLYDAMVTFVLRLAADRPILVVLDDLHWADVASLQLARLLAARVAGSAALMVLTSRDGELDTSDALRATVASVERAPGLVRVRPRALSEADVAGLVAAATGAEPVAGAAEAIHARTGGNPFFTTELVRLLRASRHLGEDAREVVRREIPPGVRDLIRLRFSRLPEGVVTTLRVAAVMGTTFDLDVLMAAAGLDEDRALELVEAALVVGVVVEVAHPVGGFRFSHGLVRDTLLEGLSEVRRTRLHRKIGQAMAATGGADPIRLFDTAHHLYAGSPAGGADEAYAWTLRAAEQATARLAFEQAEDELRRALDLLGMMPPGADLVARELGVQVQLGALMFMTRGCTEPAVEQAWARARVLAQDAADRLQLLPPLWGLWAYHCVRAEFPQALELAEELLQEGQTSGHPVFLMIGHETVGVTCWHQGRLAEARRHLEVSAAIADGLPDEVFTGVLLQEHPGVACRCFLAVVAWLLGDRHHAQAVLGEADSLARRVGHPYGVTFALFFEAWLALLERDAATVVARADGVISLAHEHGFRQWLGSATILRAWGRAELGDAEGAMSQFEEGLAENSSHGTRMLRHFLLGIVADAQHRARRSPDALVTVELAVAESDAAGERFWAAELHRLRGEVLATAGSGNATEVDECFQLALDIARSQGALALERRVAESLTARAVGGGGRRA